MKILDGTEQNTPYQKYYVYHILAKAMLANNEPKSAQVCLTEMAKLTPDITGTELQECNSVNSLT